MGGKSTSGNLKIDVVSALPAMGRLDRVYFVPIEGATGNNQYTEYIWDKDRQRFEEVGPREIDLTPYATKEALNAVGNRLTSAEAEIVAIQGDVASLDEEISTVVPIVADHTTSIAAINDSVEMLNADIAGLRTTKQDTLSAGLAIKIEDNTVGVAVFDKSKFTVFGSPTITDEGIASGFSTNNFLSVRNILPTSSNRNIVIKTKYIHQSNSFTETCYLFDYLLTSGQYNGAMVRTQTKKFAFVNTITGTSVVADTNIAPVIGQEYDIKIETDNNTYFRGYIDNIKVADLTYSASGVVPTTGNVILGISYDSQMPLLSGSIDLKHFSITVNGKQVFSGSKTLYDVLETKSDLIFNSCPFTVVGSPTITENGIASGFSNSNYLSKAINLDVSKKIECIVTFTYDSTYETRGQTFLEWVNTATRFTIYEKKFNISGSTSKGSTNLINGNKYTVKIVYENGVTEIYLLLDGSWSLELTDTYFNLSNNITGITLGSATTLSNRFWGGSIDLKQFSITVDGKRVVDGTLRNTADICNSLAGKQNKLIAGNNIVIDGNVISATGEITAEIPPATANTLGGIKVGENLSIDSNGVLSANAGGLAEVPVATANTLGGIKVGANLTITEDGTLSANAGGGSGTQITSADGATEYGELALGDTLAVADGVLNANLDELGNEVNTLASAVSTVEGSVSELQTEKQDKFDVVSPLSMETKTLEVINGYTISDNKLYPNNTFEITGGYDFCTVTTDNGLSYIDIPININTKQVCTVPFSNIQPNKHYTNLLFGYYGDSGEFIPVFTFCESGYYTYYIALNKTPITTNMSKVSLFGSRMAEYKNNQNAINNFNKTYFQLYLEGTALTGYIAMQPYGNKIYPAVLTFNPTNLEDMQKIKVVRYCHNGVTSINAEDFGVYTTGELITTSTMNGPIDLSGFTNEFSLSGNLSYNELNIKPATTSSLGAVQPDGTTITVNDAGVISASGGGASIDDTAPSEATTYSSNKVEDLLMDYVPASTYQELVARVAALEAAQSS